MKNIPLHARTIYLIDPENSDFIRWLKTNINRTGMGVSELARRTGMSKQYIHQVLLENVYPGDRLVHLLEEAFGMKYLGDIRQRRPCLLGKKIVVHEKEYYTQTDLSKMCGMRPASVSKWMDGKHFKISEVPYKNSKKRHNRRVVLYDDFIDFLDRNKVDYTIAD